MHRGTKIVTGFDILTENTVINVPGEFPTIQAALDGLNRVFIPPDVTVTIEVAAGVHTQTKYIGVNHPNGVQITIKGAEPVRYTITSFNGTNTTSFGFVLSDASGLAVDDVVAIPFIEMAGATANGHPIMGAYRINAITGNIINVTHHYRGDPAKVGSVVFTANTQFYKMPTVIKCAGCSGLMVGHDCTLGGLRNIAFVGDGSAAAEGSGTSHSGIEVGTRGGLYLTGNVACIEFGDYGAAITGNGTFADLGRGIFSGNEKDGLIISEGAAVASHTNRLIVTHNGIYGIRAVGVAPGCAMDWVVSCDNGSHGIYVEGCSAQFNNGIIGLNSGNGIVANLNAYANANLSAVFANSANDFAVGATATIRAQDVKAYIVFPTYNATLNTLTASGSIIIG